MDKISHKSKVAESPKPPKRCKIEHLFERVLTDIPVWLSCFRHSVTNYPHGRKHLVSSDENCYRTLTSIRKVVTGDCNEKQMQGCATFIPISEDTNFAVMLKCAKEFAPKMNDGRRHGWYMKGPLEKLLLWKQWKDKGSCCKK